MDLLTFIAVSATLIVIPGPNVLLIVSTSLMHGRARGLQTVAGTSTAMVVQLLLAAVGTGWLVAAISEGLIWLKWAGVIYLLYLGISAIHRAANNTGDNVDLAPSTFGRGFWVSLTNPKTIIFFSAFLPQFVNAGEPYLQQIALLSTIFWLLAVTLDSCYALMAGHLRSYFNRLHSMQIQNFLSGILYISASTALAVSEKDS